MDNKSHLAALHRKRLSSTARLMLKLGLLSSNESHLDYGCGRGGDCDRLVSLGYNSTGWDPYYFPHTNLEQNDVVTFSYVLNVLEDIQERRTSLLRAWQLTRKRMIVAAVVRGSSQIDYGKITKIGTFAKDWKHIELKGFIESTLGFEAVRLDKDKFLIHRDGLQFQPLHYDEVLQRVNAIAHAGWVAPWQTIIKRYCTSYSDKHEKKAYYRLICRKRWLPGKNNQPVRVIHIRGGLDSEHMQWAIAGLKRRNQIAELKFHCIEQSFLHEFAGFKNFDFININTVKIDNINL